MKHKKKLLTLMSLMMILNISCTTTKPQSLNEERLLSSAAIQAATCDELLDECAIVAKKQNEAIKAQQVVIDKQDEQIAAQQEQVQTEKSQKNLFLGISIGTSIALILKLIGI